MKLQKNKHLKNNTKKLRELAGVERVTSFYQKHENLCKVNCSCSNPSKKIHVIG